MAQPTKVRNRDGNIAVRDDGVFRDGDTIAEIGDGEFVRVPFMMTDSQRATAAKAVDRALADHAARTGREQALRDAVAGTHYARHRVAADAWKSEAVLAWDADYRDGLAASDGDPRAARIAAQQAEFDRNRGAR